MRVLYISYDGALEPIPQSQIVPYLRELSKKGVIAHWLSFDKSQLFSFKGEKEKLKDYFKKLGINWHTLVYHKSPFLGIKIFDILSGVIYTIFLCLKFKIDFIHARSEVSSVIALMVKKILNKPFIYDRRGYMAEDYVCGGMWKGRDSLNYKLLLKIDHLLLKESGAIIVLTKRMEKILLDQYPQLSKKIRVIPCCVDLEKFKISQYEPLSARFNLSGKKVVLYAGSVGTWYMFDEMLDFFKTAKEHIFNLHFLILSLGDLDFVKKKIISKALNLSDFTFSAATPGCIQHYIPIAEFELVFIMPIFSKIASSPTKFAEALACGVPVVINAGIGDTEDIINKEKVGIVVKEFNQDSYVLALKELEKLLGEGEALKKRCRDVAIKLFSLKDGANSYHEVYKAIAHPEAS